MRFEPRSVGDLVNVECMLVQAGNLRTEQPAASGEHQAVIAEALARAIRTGARDAHFAARDIDAFHPALDKPHADGLEDLLQRRPHPVRILLIETGADM
ncbi:hypothetical protein D3C81_1798590 [compost metagenome]